jgi:adenylate cyclase
MHEDGISRIADWLVSAGLSGESEMELLRGFAERCRGAGLRLTRAVALIDTLHPMYEGRAFRWRSDGVQEEAVVEYGPSDQGEAAAAWQRTAFYHLYTTGAEEVRRRIGFGEPADFRFLPELKDAGHTDYVAMLQRFAPRGVIGEMDAFYSHWSTDHPQGFRDADLTALRRLVPQLALAIKCASVTRIAGTLVDVYLGPDAGRRVLGGRIARGVAETINAVLWFSDLRAYTAITDSAPPGEVIPLLNDYAGVVINSVQYAGGDVLKLVGDGTLAIFKSDDPGTACRRALDAEARLRSEIADLNVRRAADGRPVTSVYLGLHIGDVFYGNIGSADRLDFTVVGPAVNEVSRIALMCRSVDREVLLSSDFVAAAGERERARFVSVGRFALRGVGHARELFTLDPDLV